MSLLTYFLESAHPVNQADLQLRDPLPASASSMLGLKSCSTSAQHLIFCYTTFGRVFYHSNRKEAKRKQMFWGEGPLTLTQEEGLGGTDTMTICILEICLLSKVERKKTVRQTVA